MKIRGYKTYLLWDSLEHAPKEVFDLIPCITNGEARLLFTSIPYYGHNSQIPLISAKLFQIPPLTDQESIRVVETILSKSKISERLFEKMKIGSGGNPRILRLWAGSIKARRRGLGKIPLEQMPDEVKSYFESLIKEIRVKSKDMDLSMNILFLLSKGEILSEGTISELFQISASKIEDQLDILREVIIPKDKGITLFQPCFAEFLKLKFPSQYLLNLRDCGIDPKLERDNVKKALAKF
jgi:hypothetical protein